MKIKQETKEELEKFQQELIDLNIKIEEQSERERAAFRQKEKLINRACAVKAAIKGLEKV